MHIPFYQRILSNLRYYYSLCKNNSFHNSTLYVIFIITKQSNQVPSADCTFNTYLRTHVIYIGLKLLSKSIINNYFIITSKR